MRTREKKQTKQEAKHLPPEIAFLFGEFYHNAKNMGKLYASLEAAETGLLAMASNTHCDAETCRDATLILDLILDLLDVAMQRFPDELKAKFKQNCIAFEDKFKGILKTKSVN